MERVCETCELSYFRCCFRTPRSYIQHPGRTPQALFWYVKKHKEIRGGSGKKESDEISRPGKNPHIPHSGVRASAYANKNYASYTPQEDQILTEFAQMHDYNPDLRWSVWEKFAKMVTTYHIVISLTPTELLSSILLGAQAPGGVDISTTFSPGQREDPEMSELSLTLIRLPRSAAQRRLTPAGHLRKDWNHKTKATRSQINSIVGSNIPMRHPFPFERELHQKLYPKFLCLRTRCPVAFQGSRMQTLLQQLNGL